jgi:ankyrin repeat protein
MDRTKIFEAVQSGDVDAVRQALADDPAAAEQRDDKGLSLLLFALYRDRAEIVDTILGAGPDLDVFDAAALGQADRLEAMLRADPTLANAFASDGFTPLHLAVFFGHPEAARLLLEMGAEVNAVARNVMRVMPLHSAVAGRNQAACGLLIAHGADVNARQHEGWTPLHGAAEHGDEELVDMLLAQGADPEAPMDRGQTAADTAAAAGHASLARRLQTRTASTT